MERWIGKVAVVTGASSGIGAGIAEKLVKAGLMVVGFARRSHLIEEHAKKLSKCKGKLYACKVDMTVEQDIIDGFQWTTENVGPVHILINNAGVLAVTNLVDGETAAWKRVLDTNVLGLAIAAREALKIMEDCDIEGHIVNINSIAGHKVIYTSGGGLYCPSKHALTSYHECLRQELNIMNRKIKVTSISPGVTQTAIMNEPSDSLKDMFKDMPFLLTEDVADGVLYVLGTPPHVQIHELTMKVMGETL